MQSWDGDSEIWIQCPPVHKYTKHTLTPHARAHTHTRALLRVRVFVPTDGLGIPNLGSDAHWHINTKHGGARLVVLCVCVCVYV